MTLLFTYFLLALKESSKEKAPEMISLLFRCARYTSLSALRSRATLASPSSGRRSALGSRHFRIASAPSSTEVLNLFELLGFQPALVPPLAGWD